MATELRRRRYGAAVRFLVTEVSEEALAVAAENAVSHGLADLMSFARGDLTDVQPAPDPPADLVVANLPYIPSAELPTLPVAATFEPALALDGGDDGLAHIRRLLPELPGVVAEGGRALLEIGSAQGPLLEEACRGLLPGWRLEIHPDLGGQPRVAALERAG